MRVTIIAIGSRGDVQPYVALGVGLREAGHAVRLATHPSFAALVGEHGLAFAPVAEGELSRGTDTTGGRAWVQRGSRFLPAWAGLLKDAASVAAQRLADCGRATEDADAIVVSVLGTLLGLQLAAMRSVPLVRAYCSPPGPLVQRAALRQAVWLCYRPWVNRARSAALSLPPLGLREPLASLDRDGPPLLYGFSPAVVPPSRTAGDRVEVTGYWLLDRPTGWTPPESHVRFLAGGEPPVVVTFGGMADAHPERTTALVLDALGRVGRRAILTRGPYLDPGATLSPDVLTVDFVPHDWLFGRVAAVVHHGGAGTTARAVHAGVPSVVVPTFADQPFWSRRVHALGIGPAPIPRKELTAERLAEAIGQATTDTRMRERAAALARRVGGEDGVGAAVAAFERHLAPATGGASSPMPPNGSRSDPAAATSGSWAAR